MLSAVGELLGIPTAAGRQVPQAQQARTLWYQEEMLLPQGTSRSLPTKHTRYQLPGRMLTGPSSRSQAGQRRMDSESNNLTAVTQRYLELERPMRWSHVLRSNVKQELWPGKSIPEHPQPSIRFRL